MKKLAGILLILFTTGISLTFSQDENWEDKEDGWHFEWGKNNSSYLDLLATSSTYFDFNFFSGPDVENFRTTLKGFGSIGNTYEVGLVAAGNKHVNAFINIGTSVRYYRFEENLNLINSEDNVTAEITEDPPYEFKNSFFGWSKNKMVLGYLTIPAGFDIKLGFADVRFQASYNRYLSGKLKLKYKDPDDTFEDNSKIFLDGLVAEENEKYKTGNDDFKDYHLNKNNFSVAVMITPNKAGEKMFTAGFRYDLKPLFEEGKGPEIHETSIFFSFAMAK
jgi:hypothetical protein